MWEANWNKPPEGFQGNTLCFAYQDLKKNIYNSLNHELKVVKWWCAKLSTCQNVLVSREQRFHDIRTVKCKLSCPPWFNKTVKPPELTAMPQAATVSEEKSCKIKPRKEESAEMEQIAHQRPIQLHILLFCLFVSSSIYIWPVCHNELNCFLPCRDSLSVFLCS